MLKGGERKKSECVKVSHMEMERKVAEKAKERR
jgi:hypothetical protein